MSYILDALSKAKKKRNINRRAGEALSVTTTGHYHAASSSKKYLLVVLTIILGASLATLVIIRNAEQPMLIAKTGPGTHRRELLASEDNPARVHLQNPGNINTTKHGAHMATDAEAGTTAEDQQENKMSAPGPGRSKNSTERVRSLEKASPPPDLPASRTPVKKTGPSIEGKGSPRGETKIVALSTAGTTSSVAVKKERKQPETARGSARTPDTSDTKATPRQEGDGKKFAIQAAVDLFNKGVEYQSGGQLERAERMYVAAIMSDSKFAPAYINLGIIYLGKDDRDSRRSAVTILEHAVELDPTNPDARIDLAIAYMKNGELDRAGQELTKALKLAPDSPLIMYNFACLYALMGDVKRSLDWLKKAAEIDEKVIEWTKEDSDLKALTGNEEFEKLRKKYKTK